jgi:hypothetical protein
MLLRIFLFSTSFFIIHFSSAQQYWGFGPAVQWQKHIGGNKADVAKDVLIRPAGGLLVVGSAQSNDGDATGHHGSTDSTDAWVVMLDEAGNIQWQRSLGGSGNDEFSTVIGTADNGYLCMGSTSSYDGDVNSNAGGYDAWLVKLSANGNIEWSKTYGDARNNYAYSGTLLADGGFGIIGADITGSYVLVAGLVWKVDVDGNINWQKTFPNKQVVAYQSFYASSIVETGDHQLLNSMGLLFNEATGDTTRLPWDLQHRAITAMTKSNGRIFFSANEENWDAYHYITKTGSIDNLVADFSSQTGPGSGPGYDSYSSYYNLTNNGLAVLPGNECILSGTQINYSRGGIYYAPFFYGGGQTEFFADGGDYDFQGFNAVTVFPNGREFVCVGKDDDSSHHYSSDCWIVKLSAKNSIRATVFLDLNNNNLQDVGEGGFNQATVQSVRPDGFSSITSLFNGLTSNTVDTGFYATSVILQNMPYYSVWPAGDTSRFTAYAQQDSMQFAIHKIANARDYAVDLFALTPARPGFTDTYKIVYSNRGTDTIINKKLIFIKDSGLQFVQSTPAFQTISGDTISWLLNDLPPGASGCVIVEMKLGQPPLQNVGDVLISTALMDSTGDIAANNNSAVLNQPVTGAYDPNDKQEVHNGVITSGEALNGYLTYTIRFQNTGNDTAFTVIVRDTLDSRLNAGAFEMISASHPYQLKLSGGKYIEWEFSTIKLVDSFRNEPGSHGYITYRVKANSTLAPGDSIINNAAIYFDFNQPVKTNDQITVLKPNTAVWTGITNTSWLEKTNWSNYELPDELSYVVIPANVPHYPVLSSNVSCYRLSVDSAASITITAGYNLLLGRK